MRLRRSLPLLLLLTPAVAQAANNDLCAPRPTGVPYLAGFPQWWSPPAPPDTFEAERWTGSARHAYGQTYPEATWFRAGWDKANRRLYLHFQVHGDTAFQGGLDHVYMAMGPAADNLLTIRIDPLVGCSGTACDGAGVAIPAGAGGQLHFRQFVGATWDASESDTPPAGWAVEHPWVITDSTANEWAVKLIVQVPNDPAYIGADGELVDTFRAYVNTIVVTAPPVVSAFQSTWPRTCAPASPGCSDPNMNIVNPTVTDQFHANMPGYNAWGQVRTGEKCELGIELDRNHVGSLPLVSGLPGNQIAKPDLAPPANTTEFVAQILNSGDRVLETNEIRATFSIADWGIAGASAAWKQIGTTTLSAGLAIGAYANGTPPPPATNSNAELKIAWAPDPSEVADYLANRHQCVRVQLGVEPAPGGAPASWGDVDFVTDSVYRNMNFATASVMRREAAINVHELGKSPTGKHKLQLRVRTSKMPSADECKRDGKRDGCDNGKGRKFTLLPGAGYPGLPKDEKGKEQQGDKGQQPEGEGQSNPRELPYYIVDAYAMGDGKINLPAQKQVPIGQYYGSFGYYAMHEGDLGGWEHALHGAKEIGPGTYEIEVADHHVATIATTIRALDEKTKPCGEDANGEGCDEPKLAKAVPWRGAKGGDGGDDGKDEPKPKPPKPDEPPKKVCGCGTDTSPGIAGLLGLFTLGFLGRRRRA